MFPKSLFAFVATSLFLANVGVEASPKPNRPDAFDSYPSDRFRKARVDKRYIPPSEFQEYYAKANGDGRVFRNAPLWRQATSKDTPIVATTVKAKKPTPDTKITSDYVYPSRHQQGAPLPITITSLLFTTPADKGFLGICSLQGASIDGIFGNSSYSFAQQFINEAQKTARCNWLSPTDSKDAFKGDGKIDHGSGNPPRTVSGDKPKQADGGLVEAQLLVL
ncbi:uncharacterized protein UBRO2_00261 [Ustilago bromivora]|uniref:Uncharacterized protein n=1 Tax=Ustilago bromivora TaxID=307758 RepID=A0A8H8QGU6_9BASI|nr:uncharacterized protein UBRO2_00261 [Ustilago bromivora]